MGRAKILSLAAIVLLAVVVAGPAWATDIATLGDEVDTDAGYVQPFQTGVLAALGADTSRVSIDLPAILWYPGTSGVPTWRIIVALRTLTGQADSVFVATLHGLSSSNSGLYRSVGLADTTAATVYPGTPKAFDVTTYSLATYRHLDVYIANIDSTASSFSGEVTVMRGR